MNNYAITVAYNGTSGTTQNIATITAAPLAITVSGVYNGTSMYTSGITTLGLVNSETITAVFVINSNVAGNGRNYIGGFSGTASSSNYSLNVNTASNQAVTGTTPVTFNGSNVSSSSNLIAGTTNAAWITPAPLAITVCETVGTVIYSTADSNGKRRRC